MRPTRPLVFSALLTVGLALTGLPASAQIDYSLGFDLGEREWDVEGRIANPDGGDLDYWIPRWTAGAYHLADFGRYVEDGLEATDDEGNPLAVERVSDSQWRIGAQGEQRVRVRYRARSISKGTLNEDMIIDVESNRIADDYAYVTPVSLFGFVPERIDEPITLEVALPDGWKADTALARDEKGVYHAPSYYRFEDSPLFFSPSHRTIELEAAGRPLGVTVYGKDEAGAREVADTCRAIVQSAAALMGGLPYTHYRFLIAFTPESQGGSGLEHSFSTLILVNQSYPPKALAGIIAHEFFHLWCAERIHVEAIHRPDYTRPLETGTIWVNEGITEYFTQHILFHADLLDEQELIQELAGGGHLPPGLGGADTSWTDVSRAAREWESMRDLMPFVVRMYAQGPRTIFALDMEMRRASGGERGIYDLLHHLNSEYVQRDRGFPEDGMVDVINEVSGGDLLGFYDRFIDGPENPDAQDYLGVIGYELVGDEVRPVEDPTDAQLRALADFLSVDGGRPGPE